MRIIKGLFDAISIRERVLLLGFIIMFLLFWATGLLKDYRAERARFHNLSNDLRTQALWFSEKETIDSGLRSALERLDPGRTYNSSQLSGRLDAIARAANLNFDMTTPRTEESDIFSIHSVRVQVRRANMEDLIAFDATIKKEFPYLGLEAFQITAPARDPRALDAVFQVFSFELKTDQF